MSAILTSIQFSDGRAVLSVPRECIEQLIAARSAGLSVHELAACLQAKCDGPVVLLSPISGMDILDQANQSTPFGFVCDDIDNNSKTVLPQKSAESGTDGAQPLHDREPSSTANATIRRSPKSANDLVHDLNNLLLVISCSAKQALSQFDHDDPRRSSVASILEAGEHAAELARQLPKAPSAETAAIAGFDLNSRLRRAEASIRRTLQPSIILTCKLTSIQATIRANPDLIDRAILDLIANAQDCMPDGGWLTIETGHDDVIGQVPGQMKLPPGRYVRICISDTGGCPLPETDSDEPDVAPDDSKLIQRTNRLKAVRQIVAEFCGHMQMETSIETGTTVEIWFPASEPVAPRRSSSWMTDMTPGPETILLAEDQSEVRKFVKSVLEAQGYQVLEARHGPAAIAIALRHAGQIHLLVTDVELPEMSGRAVAEALQADFPGLPALFMSGASDNNLVESGSTEVTDLFLQKPFGTTELLQKVRRILDRGSQDG